MYTHICCVTIVLSDVYGVQLSVLQGVAGATVGTAVGSGEV